MRAIRRILSGVLLLAAAAAVAAPLAQAELEEGTFMSEASHTTLKGEAIEAPLFSDSETGLEVTCAEGGSEATMTSFSASELQQDLKYKACKASNFGGATVDLKMNGCQFVTTGQPDPTKTHDILHIFCPVGQVIHLTITRGLLGECTVTLPEQTAENGVTIQNLGTGKNRDMRIKTTIVNATVTYDGKFSACGVVNGTVSKKFSISLTETVKGFNTIGEQVGVWFEE